MRILIDIDKTGLAELREELKQQLFFCEAYRCTLTAYVCSERRRVVNELLDKPRVTNTGAPSDSAIDAYKYRHCVNCVQDWPDFDPHKNTPKMYTPRMAMIRASVTVDPSPKHKSTRKHGPTPKTPPSKCPSCGYGIDQKNSYRRYNFSKGKCCACIISERNHIAQARKRAALSIDIVCNHRNTCGMQSCAHAVPHKHGFGKRMTHTCTLIGKVVTCDFDTTND